MAAHGTSGMMALLLAVLTFAGMQVFRSTLASSQPLTILGGAIGSIVFLFLLTAVSNLEMEQFGANFKAGLIPEVAGCLFVAMVASGLVHRVCITTCIIFSMLLLYSMNRISNNHYAPPSERHGAAAVNAAETKKKK